MSSAIRKYNPVSLSQSEEVLVPPYLEEDGFVLYNDDCLKVMAGLRESSIDMIFADSPFFLSNNGMTYKSGKMVSVNKGEPLVGSFRDFATEVYKLKEKLIKLNGERI